MTRNLLIIAAFFVLVFGLSQLGKIERIRILADSVFVYPVKGALRHFLTGEISQKKTEVMIVGNYSEKIALLEQENKTLRQQLGTIPEEGELFPARVLWITSGELIARFPYPHSRIQKGAPVVFDKLFVGTVDRVEGETMVVHKATDSIFSIDGRSDKGSQGKVLGSFNEEVRFETNVDAPLSKGDRVYALDKISGGIYLVGTVRNILLNERLPVKTAMLEYLADGAQLETVFVLQK